MVLRVFALCLSVLTIGGYAADSVSVRDKFISLVFKDEHVTKIKAQMINGAVSRNPNFAEYKEELKTWADEVFAVDSIRNRVSAFFDTTFSHQDMLEVVRFYESGAGRRFLACNDGLSRHMQELMQNRFSSQLVNLQTSISRKKRSTLEPINTPSFEGAKVEDPAGRYRFKFEKDRWHLLDENLTPHADFSFEHENGALMGVILSEGRAIDSEALKEAAKRNLRLGSDRMTVISERDMATDTDTNEGFFLEMNARMRSQELRYFGYVVGGSGGGVQVLCWTYANKANQYRDEAIAFLKGLQSFIN